MRQEIEKEWQKTAKQHGFEYTEELREAFKKWHKKEKAGFDAFCQKKKAELERVRREIDDLPKAIPFRNGKKGEEYKERIVLQKTVKTAAFRGFEECGLRAETKVEQSKDGDENGVKKEHEKTEAETRLDAGERKEIADAATDNRDNVLSVTVSGIPSKAGEFEILMRYTYHGWIKGIPILERSFRFTVIPDPKDLWQDLPVPEDIEYPTKNSATEYIPAQDAAKRTLIAASQRGRSHAHHGKPRDDSFYLSTWNEWYILAVSDGAGSAAFSREGARIACQVASDSCKANLQELEKDESALACIASFVSQNGGDRASGVQTAMNKVLYAAAQAAHIAIRDEAIHEKRAIKDYAATLLLVICKKFEGSWFFAAFGVGDGAMAVLRSTPAGAEDGAPQFEAKLLAEPDEGEFSGQTRFLTMREIFGDRQRIRLATFPDFTAIALMTDGVSDAKFETDASLNNPQKWRELWDDVHSTALTQKENPQEALLEWLNFWSPGNHDDRTIALLY